MQLDVQDLIRESPYLSLRQKLTRQSEHVLAAAEANSRPLDHAKIMPTVRGWELAGAVSRLDGAYGEGRYHDAIAILRELEKCVAQK
jgi:hypothetical protein